MEKAMDEAAAEEVGVPPDENGQTPAALSGWLLARIPALDSLRTYSWRSLRLDLFAGLTVAAIAVPQAMAYASIPQLPVQYGLYTAIVMTAVGALFDSSRQLINGPTNAICIALASSLAIVPEKERLAAAILMAFLVGVVQTTITLFRLGDLTRFISQSVIVGFTLGAALLLALDQLKNLLGLAPQGSYDDHFLVRFFWTMSRVEHVNYLALAIGVASMLLALLLRALGDRLKSMLPDFLIVVVLMAGGVWFFHREDTGDGPDAGAPELGMAIELGFCRWEGSIEVIGKVPDKMPWFEVPELSWSRIRQLTSSALAIAVLGLLEAIAMAKAIAARTHQKLDIHQQCLSEGLANLVGSFFRCIPGSGSLTRSAINVHAGAVSQWSGVFSAVAVALTVLLLAPWARYIPRACLAGILLISAWRLVDRKQLSYHLRATRFDMQIVLATAFAAVAVNVEFCILIGVFLSVVLYVRRAARLQLTELTVTADRVLRERGPSDPRCDRILLFSLEGELFFGSAPDLERHFETIEASAQPGTRVIVLRLKRVRNPDAVCVELFDRFIHRLRQRGIHLLLCGVRNDFARVMHASGVEAQLGKDYIFREQAGPASSTLAAVRFAYDLLENDYCSVCPRRSETDQETLYYMI
jgi:SulP family sulfate permease